MDIVINPNFYIEKLKRRLINNELLALRSALRSIEKGANQELGSFSQHSPTNIAILQEIDPEEATQSEIKKTYCAIVRAFTDYVDELMAIQKFMAMPQKLNGSINSHIELDKYVREQIAKKAQQIGKDGHLTGPKKLSMLGSLGKFLDEATAGYFDLRSAIEHHKGITQREIKVSYYDQEYLVGGEPMKLNKPMVVKDTTIDLQISEVSHAVKKGTAIRLSEAEIEGIIMTICLHIAPGIAKQAFV